MIVTVLRQNGHNRGGGAALAGALRVPHAPPTARRKCRDQRLIINWGVSSPPTWQSRGFFYSNNPQAVANCANKLSCFRLLLDAGVPSLEFTQSIDQAVQWCQADGKVVGRRILNGHSGQGLEIIRRENINPRADDPGPLADIPLFTRYFRKNAEYRVHVAFGRVVLIQQKRKENGYDGANNPLHELVRTHDNGWVFCINDLDCDTLRYRERLEQLAIQAIQAVGANHGAVDILVRHATNGNTKTFDRAVVCEINSAPAIRAGSTLEAYRNAFRQWIDDRTRQLGQRA